MAGNEPNLQPFLVRKVAQPVESWRAAVSGPRPLSLVKQPDHNRITAGLPNGPRGLRFHDSAEVISGWGGRAEVFLDAESQRESAGEAGLEVQQSDPFRRDGDTHHRLNH